MGVVVAFGVMNVRVYLLKASHALKIESAVQSVQQQCEDNAQITESVSNDLQNEITNLRGRLASLKRVRVNVPIANTPIKCDAGNGRGYVDRDGVNSETLYDYAGKAEHYRRQLNACQDFITKVRE